MSESSAYDIGASKAHLKWTEEQLVAGLIFKGDRSEIRERLSRLRKVCGSRACGEPIVLFDYGVYSDQPEIEVCVPVSEPVTEGDVTSRVLQSIPVIAYRFEGPISSIEEAYSPTREYLRSRAVVPALPLREVFIKWPEESDSPAILEVQVGLHGWGRRLVEAMDLVLGDEKRSEIMGEGPDLDDHELTADQRFARVKDVISRLEKETDESQKYAVLSCCADRFSEKRIVQLKALYDKTGSVDPVIEEMSKDFAWYEAPRREGTIIYVTKIPADREGYEKAEDSASKKKCYCHCTLVRTRLEEGMPDTYCYCGAGWYRQQWEGILGRPVKIRLLKSLLRGDDNCQFAIELPEDVLTE